ncbi:MAG: DUF6712 family protein [Mucinivorans sp.]
MISSIQQFKAILPTVIGDDITIYQSSIDGAYRWIAREILGAELATNAKLTDKIDVAVAYRAYKEAIPMLDLVNTSNGFAVISDASYVPASRERVSALISAVDRSLRDSLADLYEYIEDDVALAPIFAKFGRSTIVSGSLLPTRRQACAYAVFDGGYPEWIGLRGKHQLILTTTLYARFGRELIDAVVNAKDNLRVLPIAEPLKYAFAALLINDNNTTTAMMTIIDGELRNHPDLYPEHIISEQKVFESKSVISFL